MRGLSPYPAAHAKIQNPEGEVLDLKIFATELALKTDEKGEKSLYVPLLIKVKNGKMTDYHFSLVSSFSVDKSLKLNDTEEKELYEIYRRMIEE